LQQTTPGKPLCIQPARVIRGDGVGGGGLGV